MIHIIPLSKLSANWEVHKYEFGSQLNNIVDFAVKLTINNVPKMKRSEIDVNIHSVSPNFIKYLNKKHRKVDKATNVLSFSCDAILDELDIDLPRELGDVFICNRIVEKEAKAQNKKFLDHMVHMIVHGTLHLMGFDHEEKEDAVKMEQKEIYILQSIGIKNPYIELPETLE